MKFAFCSIVQASTEANKASRGIGCSLAKVSQQDLRSHAHYSMSPSSVTFAVCMALAAVSCNAMSAVCTQQATADLGQSMWAVCFWLGCPVAVIIILVIATHSDCKWVSFFAHMAILSWSNFWLVAMGFTAMRCGTNPKFIDVLGPMLGDMVPVFLFSFGEKIDFVSPVRHLKRVGNLTCNVWCLGEFIDMTIAYESSSWRSGLVLLYLGTMILEIAVNFILAYRENKANRGIHNEALEALHQVLDCWQLLCQVCMSVLVLAGGIENTEEFLVMKAIVDFVQFDSLEEWVVGNPGKGISLAVIAAALALSAASSYMIHKAEEHAGAAFGKIVLAITFFVFFCGCREWSNRVADGDDMGSSAEQNKRLPMLISWESVRESVTDKIAKASYMADGDARIAINLPMADVTTMAQTLNIDDAMRSVADVPIVGTKKRRAYGLVVGTAAQTDGHDFKRRKTDAETEQLAETETDNEAEMAFEVRDVAPGFFTVAQTDELVCNTLVCKTQ